MIDITLYGWLHIDYSLPGMRDSEVTLMIEPRLLSRGYGQMDRTLHLAGDGCYRLGVWIPFLLLEMWHIGHTVIISLDTDKTCMLLAECARVCSCA